MNKSNRLLLLILAAQAALIMGMRVAGHQEPEATQGKLLDPFDPEKVTRIKVLGAPKEKDDDPDQNSVELAKEGDNWGIATADGYPADKEKVDDLLKAIKKLRTRNVVLTKSTYHKKLEVTDDKFERKLTMTHDGKEHTLYVGSSPSFKNTHVRLDGQDQVYLANDFSTSDVGDRAWNWVDRTYMKFKKEDVWSVKVANKQGIIELEKNPADDQWIAPTTTKELDTTTVNSIVNKASSINLESPVGKTEKPEHGFEAPLATITLITGTSTIAGVPPPETKKTTVTIGKKLEKENRYFVKASNSEYVVQVAGWAVDPLVNKGPKDLVKEEK